jgi:hypothetical protein
MRDRLKWKSDTGSLAGQMWFEQVAGGSREEQIGSEIGQRSGWGDLNIRVKCKSIPIFVEVDPEWGSSWIENGTRWLFQIQFKGGINFD